MPNLSIRPTDRVHAVLQKDEKLLEVFTDTSKVFEKLRSPSLRRTMARLVTVEQAARIAGIDADTLVARLNEAMGDLAADTRDKADSLSPLPSPPADSSSASTASTASGSADASDADPSSESGRDAGDERRLNVVDSDAPPAVPDRLRELPPELLFDADVRDDLRKGQEPLGRILQKARQVPDGGVLRVRAIFEPVPLYHVLGRQGFSHYTERFADDDWRVWFHRDGGSGAASDSRPADATDSVEDTTVVLDVRGLEPPEPMVRTLEALESLQRGCTLIQLNVRVPQFLIAELERRGFIWEVREQSEDLVRVFIRHGDDA